MALSLRRFIHNSARHTKNAAAGTQTSGGRMAAASSAPAKTETKPTELSFHCLVQEERQRLQEEDVGALGSVALGECCAAADYRAGALGSQRFQCMQGSRRWR